MFIVSKNKMKPEDLLELVKYVSVDENSAFNADWLNSIKRGWIAMPASEKLYHLASFERRLTDDIPEAVKENLLSEIKDLFTKREQHLKKIANRHVMLYKNKYTNEWAGYITMGMNGPERKWIVNGDPDFIKVYLTVIDDETSKHFESIYSLYKGTIEDEHLNIIRELDSKHSESRLYRIKRFAPLGEEKTIDPEYLDSGWVPDK